MNASLHAQVPHKLAYNHGLGTLYRCGICLYENEGRGGGASRKGKGEKNDKKNKKQKDKQRSGSGTSSGRGNDSTGDGGGGGGGTVIYPHMTVYSPLTRNDMPCVRLVVLYQPMPQAIEALKVVGTEGSSH